MFMMAQAHLGVVNCYEPATAEKNVLGANVAGYRGEQYVLGDGSVSLESWTPNALEYDVNARGISTVVINQNFDPQWHIEEGKGELYKVNGLLGIQVPPGKQRLRIVYHDGSFLIGCVIFVVGLLAASTLYVWCGVWGL